MLLSTVADPQIWLTLIVLTSLEIVLGVDNLVFLSLASSRLPTEQRANARRLGIMFAMVTRLILLALAFWLVYLTAPVFHVGTHPVSIRDIFLFFGGLFLIWKSIDEIRHSFRKASGKTFNHASKRFHTVVMQIALLDMVFSLDSVMTAVGVTRHYWVMATAIVIAMFVMLFSSGYMSRLILRFPRVRLLALCFLSLIGLVLLVEGCGVHVPKTSIFIALIFAVFVEAIHAFYERIKKRNKDKE
jgi:predicted tellurium resistance membrane protein TerC